MGDLADALGRAQAGDAGAMADLYRAYAAPLLAYLLTQVRRREDAEDLLGEVFLQAMRDVGRFRGDLSGFRAWLYRIASNRAVDLARRNQRRPEEPLALAIEQPAASDPAGEAMGRVDRERLWRAVMDLPAEQRKVVAMRLAGGLTAPEIAEAVGKPVGAVKALQHRALVNLTKALATPYPAVAEGRFEPREDNP
ncbi:MAG TPA: sigma-70 family RNA polymerase sigma factor [Actinomycetota bacterium]|nr:sigma-70 family RNA polymerase sigma factor [Actinomycetota bacterium]